MSSFYLTMEKDGETMTLREDGLVVERGDEMSPIPALWTMIFNHKIDEYITWLASEWRGYKVGVEGWLVNGLPPPPSLFYLSINDVMVDGYNAVYIGRMYMKDKYNVGQHAGEGSTGQT